MQYAKLFRWLTSLYGKVPYYLLGGYAFPPMFIFLRLTSKCNLSCKHCFMFQCRDEKRINDPDSDLTLSEIKEIIEQVSRKAVISVIGAEVFTRTDIMESLKLICCRNPCRLITNATLISERGCESLIDMGSKYLFGKGLLSVAISLHGSNETIHDGITMVDGSYHQTINTAKRLIEIRRDRRQKYPLIDLTIVILKENVEGLNDIFDSAEEMGVDSCNFIIHRRIMPRKYSPNSDDFGILYESPPEGELIERSIIEKQLLSLVRRARKSSVQLRFTPSNMPISEIVNYYNNEIDLYDYTCSTYPWLRLFVESNGDLGLCHYHTHSSIRKERIDEVWNSQPFVRFRKLVKKNRIFPACYGCSNLCYVGKDSRLGH